MVRLRRAGAFLLVSTFARTLPVTVHNVREGEALCISRNRHLREVGKPGGKSRPWQRRVCPSSGQTGRGAGELKGGAR